MTGISEARETRKYIALIRQEEGTDYWVDVPDIPGCVSQGKTIDEAMDNFQKAINLHFENMAGALPVARDKDEILGQEEDPWLQACWIEISKDDILRTAFSTISAP